MPAPEPYTLWPSQILAGEAIGHLMAFWGFTKSMGRIWTVLYLSDEPLTALQLRQGLGLSTGAVSMTLNELDRWGVVHRVKVPGSRAAHFEAETDLWRLIRRVLRERERREVDGVVAALRAAIAAVDEQAAAADPARRAAAGRQRRRLASLLELFQRAGRVLDAFLATDRLDLSPVARFLLRR